MRTTTAIILLGQSLDNPELSERDIRNTGIQFFARQGIALISLESVPQPVQDLAIATLSTAIFRSPSHLINWGVSTSFTLINTTLIEDLPPDVPQSTYNFYAARVLNPLSTNAALQAFIAEKVTQAGLRLLRSLEDSDHTTEDLTPTVPLEEPPLETVTPPTPEEIQQRIAQLPKPELVHTEYYIDRSNTIFDNPQLEGTEYGDFNSRKEAQQFIELLKGQNLADNNRKLTLYNLKVKALLLGVSPEQLPSDPQFSQLNLSLRVDEDKAKLYRGEQRVFKVSKGTVKKQPERFKKGITEAKKHIHTHNVTNDGLLQTFETELQALFPAHIMAPNPLQKAFPIIKHTNTVCTLTPSGEVADRVTFSTREQAESVRTFQAGHEADIYTCQTISFEMEKQAVQHGVAIESLPECGPFVQTQLQVKVHGDRHFSLLINGKTAHTFKGKDAFTQLDSKLSDYRRADRGANQSTLNQHQAQLSTLTGAPITQTKLTPSERSHLMNDMLPFVKTEKEHGRWFRGWRSAKATGSKGVQWLRDIGLAGVSVDVAQTGINAPKPTHSTPSYAGTYGPDVARSPSIPATSHTHSIATSSPVENRGWQDVEEMQQHQMFERNMAYKSPVNSSPQTPIDYQTLWGEGVGPEVQFPPTTFDGAQLNNPTVATTDTPSYEPSPALGLLPHLVVKVVNHVKTHGFRPAPSERPQQQAPLVYSPYMRAHRPQTLSLETLPIPERRVGKELLEYVDQVVNQYAYETEHNFFQSNIDTHIGSLKGCGSFIKETSKVIIVIGTPFLSRHQLEATLDHIDSSTAVLDAHFNRAIQHINPSYNPDSASSKMGTFLGEYVIPSLIPTGVAFQGPSRTVVYIHPEALTQRLQQILHTLENPRLPSLDRLFVPNGRPALAGGRISPFQQGRGKLEMQMPRSSTNRASSSKLPEKASKAINLPSWRKVGVNIDHVAAGHLNGGWRTMCEGSRKTLFPEGFSKPQLEKIIRQAYKNGKKIRTAQDNKIIVVGEYNGTKIEMYVNTKTKTIETAYPKKS
ncbi:MAG: EndoU domain-containing protein [Simkaniaceae bacterium]|nr:MAG: EndoU domain-containing protein [Simkaniaceae bacterium]